MAINARTEGATGSGVVVDSAVLQQVVNQLAPAGGEVDLPFGSYLINTPIVLPTGSRYVFRGEGKLGSQILWASGFAGPSFTLTGTAVLALQDIGVPDWNTVAVLAAPGVPASTTPLTNPFPFPVAVFITAGTVTVVAINATTVFTATPCTLILLSGDTVTLTYSVIPTWVWRGLAD